MKRLMFVGATGAGKRSLIRALMEEDLPPHRPMSINYHGPYINTPGEFLENRRFYPALITASADCDVVVFVQDASRRTSRFPPLFASAFNRRVIGIVTRISVDGADVARAERFLRQAGAREILRVDITNREDLDAIESLAAREEARSPDLPTHVEATPRT